MYLFSFSQPTIPNLKSNLLKHQSGGISTKPILCFKISTNIGHGDKICRSKVVVSFLCAKCTNECLTKGKFHLLQIKLF